MRESPFKIRVGGRDESEVDPTAVTAIGDGLREAETGSWFRTSTFP